MNYNYKKNQSKVMINIEMDYGHNSHSLKSVNHLMHAKCLMASRCTDTVYSPFTKNKYTIAVFSTSKPKYPHFSFFPSLVKLFAPLLYSFSRCCTEVMAPSTDSLLTRLLMLDAVPNSSANILLTRAIWSLGGMMREIMLVPLLYTDNKHKTLQNEWQ